LWIAAAVCGHKVRNGLVPEKFEAFTAVIMMNAVFWDVTTVKIPNII
jgi:hypothetical protein